MAILWSFLLEIARNSSFWNKNRKKSGYFSKNHKNALQKLEVANLHGRAPPSLTRSGVRRAPVELGHGSAAGFLSEMCVFYGFWATFRNCRFFYPEFISMCRGVPVAKDHLSGDVLCWREAVRRPDRRREARGSPREVPCEAATGRARGDDRDNKISPP